MPGGIDMKGDGAKERTARIRELNDELRKTMSGGVVVMTAGVRASGFDTEVIEAVRAFEDFTPGNDPYGEHDFGCVWVRGEKFFWKVDYYDKLLRFHSEDEADPARTTRVLTIMRADEY
jgi:hypothetical protein